MAKEKKDKKQLSRRNFLRSGAAIGAGAVVGGGILGLTKNALAENTAKVKVLTTNGKVFEINKEALQEDNHECKHESGTQHAREGIPYRKFVMVYDLRNCSNARKCIEACQKGHHLAPDQEWLKVYKMQESEDSAPYWFPKSCYHCDNAPCTDVCPVSATFKRSDGIVLIDADQCIGCKYCMVACPYQARVFNYNKPDLPEDVANRKYCPETSVPPKAGTVGKCDFCPDLSAVGELPYCVKACPNGAILFGDIQEDAVTNGVDTYRFSEIAEQKSAYRYMEYFGTEPNTYYLPPVDRNFPFKEESEEDEE